MQSLLLPLGNLFFFSGLTIRTRRFGVTLFNWEVRREGNFYGSLPKEAPASERGLRGRLLAEMFL
jgi:hypothetical protein